MARILHVIPECARCDSEEVMDQSPCPLINDLPGDIQGMNLAERTTRELSFDQRLLPIGHWSRPKSSFGEDPSSALPAS
jgi:hypothetical protein